MLRRAAITSVGHYLPGRKVLNSWFTSAPDPDYIERKTGILERYWLESGGTSEMVVPAVNACLRRRGLDIDAVDCLLVATITPDRIFPSTAAMALKKLGSTKTFGFDISAACSGFIYGLHIASKMIETGSAKRIVVCGADKMSSSIAFGNLHTSMILADGAGVALLEAADDPSLSILDTFCGTDPSGADDVYVPAGGTEIELTPACLAASANKMVMNGRAVYEAGVKAMVYSSNVILARNGMTTDDIDRFVPHQSNLRMLEDVTDKIGISRDKLLVNVDKVGNTSAASIPLCLSQKLDEAQLHRGDTILLTSVGAGYTYGSALLRWSID